MQRFCVGFACGNAILFVIYFKGVAVGFAVLHRFCEVLKKNLFARARGAILSSYIFRSIVVFGKMGAKLAVVGTIV